MRIILADGSSVLIDEPRGHRASVTNGLVIAFLTDTGCVPRVLLGLRLSPEKTRNLSLSANQATFETRHKSLYNNDCSVSF